jgi:hypothetical protein
MVTSIKVDAVSGTSLKSLVQGYLLTKQTEGLSSNHVKYCQGILGRFLWYRDRAEWSDTAGSLTEWHIREFMGYVSSAVDRWNKTGNGSESSSRKASAEQIIHQEPRLGLILKQLEANFDARNKEESEETPLSPEIETFLRGLDRRFRQA